MGGLPGLGSNEPAIAGVLAKVAVAKGYGLVYGAATTTGPCPLHTMRPVADQGTSLEPSRIRNNSSRAARATTSVP